MRKIAIIALFVSLCSCFMAQNRYADSLHKILKLHPNDTIGAKVLNNLSTSAGDNGDYRASFKYGMESLNLAKKLNFYKCQTSAMSNIGNAYMFLGEYDSALIYHNSAIELQRKIKDIAGIARSYSNIGNVYQYQGKFDKAIANGKKTLAFCESNGLIEMTVDSYINLSNSYFYIGERGKTLEYLFKALSISEKNKLSSELSCLNNIGVVYAEQKDYPNSLKYFERALDLNKKIGRKVGIANSYANLGGIYMYLKEFDKAIDYAKKAIALDREMGVRSSIANGLGNLAGMYLDKKDYDTAMAYARESFRMYEELGQPEGLANMNVIISKVYTSTGKFKEAEPYAIKSLELSKEIGLLSGIREAELQLSDIYSALKRTDQALQHYKQFVRYRDSLTNSENTRDITQKEMNYEFGKQMEKEKAEQEKKDIENELLQKQQRIVIFSVIAGLILVLVFSLFLYKRFKLTQKQNEIIISKNSQIEEQNKEIIDSITYAKRLQDAILPNIDSIKNILPETFVLYKPKAIVAGDFYWAEKIGDEFFIAAADSTGHGVPGAIVSVVCSNALNRSVKEFHLTDTGKILDKTRELVLETFEKSSENVKDGMDISLLSINLKTKKVFWSGANNSLWYIQNNEIKEIKADKQPIGLSDGPKPFTRHTINNAEGCSFYLFTDGFADQFGGPNGKKFKYKQFSDLILHNSHLNMTEQMNVINTSFTNWKGELEQVDDVCVIGIKL